MNIQRALILSGYSSDAPRDERIDELTWLATQASTRNRIAELGSWQGHSMLAMADSMPTDGIAYAVDMWRDTQDMAPYNDRCKDDPEFLANSFRNNIGPELIDSGRVRPVRMSTVTGANFLRERGVKLDMIFIDAAHDYASVKADILAWQPLLEPNGLLCGHDYWHQGVVQAVSELLPMHIKAGAGSIWMVPCQR